MKSGEGGTRKQGSILPATPATQGKAEAFIASGAATSTNWSLTAFQLRTAGWEGGREGVGARKSERVWNLGMGKSGRGAGRDG